MPLLSRYFVRTSLVYLAAGLLLSLAVSLPSIWPSGLPVAVLRPIPIHWLAVGWLTQLIMGVMHWMFPKHSQERPRGHEWLIWSTYFALNAGLLLRTVSEPAASLARTDGWVWLLVLSAVLQWLAAVAFVLNTWPRVGQR